MPTDAPDPPNVLLIYTDDQPQEWVGCYGGDVLTPNIDRLATEGVRFDRYYVSSPVCSPSRYTALTGRYASRSPRFHAEYPPGGPVNIGWNPGVVEGEPTVANVLGENGYTTGFVGKWHLGVEGEVESVPADADGRDPETARAIRENYETLRAQVEGCGFDEARSVYAGNVFDWELPAAMERHNMEWVTRGALDFLDAHADERFFLCVAPTLTHDPWDREQIESDPRITPAGYIDDPPDVQPPREDVLDRVAAADRTGREPTDAEQPAFMGHEEVLTGRTFATWLDDGVGAILDRLEALGIAEETLVIFTSDHGNRGKFTCYDAGARQPCIARWPAVLDPGEPREELVSNVDLAPTLFDLAGADPGCTVDGRSFASLLTGEESYERESVYLEITTERAVVTDDNYKYIAVRYPPDVQAAVDRGTAHSHWCVPLEDAGLTFGAEEDFPGYFDADQLYDLEADPAEQRNLARESGYADRLREMKATLRAYSHTLPHAFGEFAAGD